MPRLCLVLLAILLLAPSAARAQSESFFLPRGLEPTTSVVLVGDRVAWVSRNAAFVRERDGAVRELDRWEPWGAREFTTIRAAADRVLIKRLRRVCSEDTLCHASAQFRYGPIAGPLVVHSACPEATPVLAGSLVAEHCVPERFEVVADGGGQAGRVIEPGGWNDVYGERIRATPLADRITVVDWRTGEQLFSVPFRPHLSALAPYDSFDVAADDAIAWTENREVRWASAAEPFVHSVGTSGMFVRMEGDLLLISGGVDDDQPYSVVVRRDGSLVAALHGRASYEFDGHRVLWVDGCAGLVQIWDLADQPPADRGRCGVPAIRSTSVRLRPGRAPSVTLACAASTPAGCGGRLVVSAVPHCTRDGCAQSVATFSLAPGERRDVAVRGAGELRKRMRNHRRRVRVEVRAKTDERVLATKVLPAALG